MRIQELGHVIRTARRARDLTQAKLAESVGLSRVTINKLEGGLGELGVRKVLKILEQLDVELVADRRRPHRPDYVRMACTMASVSFKDRLTEDELIEALRKGKVPHGRAPHLRALLEEAPTALLSNLATEAARWLSRDRLSKNLVRLIDATGSSRRVDEWLKTD